MNVSVEMRMKSLEQAILNNEREPSWLKRVVRNVDASKKVVEEAIEEVKNDPEFQQMEDKRMEFNRNFLPPLLAKWIFYRKMYEYECAVHTKCGEKKRLYIEGELHKSEEFVLQHRRFALYYFSERISEDRKLFLNGDMLDSAPLPNDDERMFAVNPNSLLAAYLLAYHEYMTMLQKETEVDGIGSPDPWAEAEVAWCGKDIDLVELGMAIWVSEELRVNGKPATQAFIKNRLELFFNTKILNWDARVQELKNRKKEPTAKLNALVRRLAHYLGQLPEDRSARR